MSVPHHATIRSKGRSHLALLAIPRTPRTCAQITYNSRAVSKHAEPSITNSNCHGPHRSTGDANVQHETPTTQSNQVIKISKGAHKVSAPVKIADGCISVRVFLAQSTQAIDRTKKIKGNTQEEDRYGVAWHSGTKSRDVEKGEPPTRHCTSQSIIAEIQRPGYAQKSDKQGFYKLIRTSSMCLLLALQNAVIRFAIPRISENSIAMADCLCAR